MSFAFVNRRNCRTTIRSEDIEEIIHKASNIAADQMYDLKEAAIHPEISALFLRHLHTQTKYEIKLSGRENVSIRTAGGAVEIIADPKMSRDQIIFRACKNDQWVVEIQNLGVEDKAHPVYTEDKFWEELEKKPKEPSFVDLLKEIK